MDHSCVGMEILIMALMSYVPFFAHHESGHFRARPAWRTDRPVPADHLLIWVRAGGMEITVGHRSHVASAGDLVILEPGVRHAYEPESATGWEWLWLHFGGSEAAELTRRLQGEIGGPVRHLGSDARVTARFTELIISAASATTDGARLRVDSCAYSLIGLMVDRLESPEARSEGSGVAMAGLTTWILDHLDASVTLADLVEVSAWSAAQLSRLTRRELGLSPMQYVTRLKMRHAERLLRDTELTVGAVGRMIGFDDPLHFSRRFSQVTGRSPSALRAESGSA